MSQTTTLADTPQHIDTFLTCWLTAKGFKILKFCQVIIYYLSPVLKIIQMGNIYAGKRETAPDLQVNPHINDWTAYHFEPFGYF